MLGFILFVQVTSQPNKHYANLCRLIQHTAKKYFIVYTATFYYISKPNSCAHVTLHHKDNEIYDYSYHGNIPSLCKIYTMNITGRYRSAKCLNNSIHMQIRKGQRGIKREWVEGAGSWHQTQSYRLGDGAVLYTQLSLYCTTAESIASC